jgi:hypothetical protein
MADPESDSPPAPDNIRPSSNLVSSDKYNGKAVYGAEQNKIGSIESVMVDKSTGEPAYAVLSIGGILGMGADHYPVPWRLLRHDPELDGYRSDISGNRLKGYPKSVFGSSGSELFDWTAKRAELDSYYDNVDTVTTKEAEESPLTRSSG